MPQMVRPHPGVGEGDGFVLSQGAPRIGLKACSLVGAGLVLLLLITAGLGVPLLLMFLAFGSVVLPVKGVAMTLLSLTASFGALVWVFQDGNLSQFLGFTAPGFTMSALTKWAAPSAAIKMSARRQCSAMFRVWEWQIVTVALAFFAFCTSRSWSIWSRRALAVYSLSASCNFGPVMPSPRRLRSKSRRCDSIVSCRGRHMYQDRPS